MLYLPFLGGIVGAGAFYAFAQQVPDSMQYTLQAAYGVSATVGTVAAGLVGWVLKKTNQEEDVNMHDAEDRIKYWEKPEKDNLNNEQASNPQKDPEEVDARVDPAPPVIATNRSLEQVRESLRVAQMLVEEIEKSERSWHEALDKLQTIEEAISECVTAAEAFTDKVIRAQSLLRDLAATIRERRT
jgi:phosphate/sulfate permease